MKGTAAIADAYTKMRGPERVSFLDFHVNDTTVLTQDFLVEALRNESEALPKWYLVKGLGILRSSAGIVPIINVCKEGDLNFGHTSVHAICAWALGRIGQPALEHVLGLLNRTDVETIRCAVDSLGEIGDPRAIPALCSQFRKGDETIQLWAGLSLAKLGNGSLLFLHRVAVQSSLRTRIIALDAIIRIGSRQSTPVLRELFRNGTYADRRFILEWGDRFHKDLVRDIEAVALDEENALSDLARTVLHRGMFNS